MLSTKRHSIRSNLASVPVAIGVRLVGVVPGDGVGEHVGVLRCMNITVRERVGGDVDKTRRGRHVGKFTEGGCLGWCCRGRLQELAVLIVKAGNRSHDQSRHTFIGPVPSSPEATPPRQHPYSAARGVIPPLSYDYEQSRHITTILLIFPCPYFISDQGSCTWKSPYRIAAEDLWP